MKKDHFLKRLIIMILGVCSMGFSLSLLISINLGTDPYSCANLGISEKLGVSLGLWQFLGNAILFVFVFFLDKKQIGLGTLVNMIGVGYSADFFRYLWSILLPEDFFKQTAVRYGLLVPVLLLFIVSVAFYIAADLGVAPYDALSFIIADRQSRLSFRVVRILWDLLAILVGWVLGSTVGIVTVLSAFLFGPVITAVSKKLDKVFQ